MPAEPQRNTEHRVQHFMLDGFRTLQEQLAALPQDLTDEATRAAIAKMIDQLMPMVGLRLTVAPARVYGLAHSLRVLVEDIRPYSGLDYEGVPEALRTLEDRLLAVRPPPDGRTNNG